MGAWGYGTFDNDSAADWVCAFEKYLTKSIKTPSAIGGPGADYYDENLAAIHILASCSLSCSDLIGNSFPNFEIVDLAFNRIEEILKDEDWLETWSDKDRKIEEINKLKNKLKIMRNKLVANEIVK